MCNARLDVKRTGRGRICRPSACRKGMAASECHQRECNGAAYHELIMSCNGGVIVPGRLRHWGSPSNKSHEGTTMRLVFIVLAIVVIGSPVAAAGAPSEAQMQAATILLHTIELQIEMAVGASSMADAVIQQNPMLGPYRDVILQ